MDPLRRDRPVRGGGLFALLTALLGLFRFDYALNRLHARRHRRHAGAEVVLLGVMVAVGFRAVLWKLVLVLVIQWYTSPLSSHMLRNSSTGPGRRIWPAIWSCRRRRRR